MMSRSSVRAGGFISELPASGGFPGVWEVAPCVVFPPGACPLGCVAGLVWFSKTSGMVLRRTSMLEPGSILAVSAVYVGTGLPEVFH